jgi:arginine decarboxylase
MIDRSEQRRSPLHVAVVAGVGEGRTTLSAFDAALFVCGVHNYNLLALSSVIPPAAHVCPRDRYVPAVDEHGHRLYVVKAEMRSAQEGAVIAAGLGWLQWGDGRGVFVEHELISADLAPAEAEAALAAEIDASLRDLAQTRDVAFSAARAHTQVISTVVAGRPASALVLAVYESEAWMGSDLAWIGGRR